MATERAQQWARRALVGYAAALCTLLAPPLPARAATAPVPTPRPVPASEPWWVRVGFAGERVTAVGANQGHITVAIAAGPQRSDDGGHTWHRVIARPDLPGPGPTWRVVGSTIGRIDGGAFHPDPGAPAAQPGLLAAPAALPGVVVAVDRDGVVWRRGADGDWKRALLLLPEHLAAGPPHITALIAFEHVPLSDAVYLGSDGYAVLQSTNGGDDWVRAGPGLPDNVLALATDDSTQSLYAATADGLWVHHLRATPSPPAYADRALHWRWLGLALVTLAAVGLTTAGLLRALR